MSAHKQVMQTSLGKPSSESKRAKKEASLKYAYNHKKSQEPKRNKSAFVIFSNQTRAKLKEQGKHNPNANEMMITLGEMWKNLTKEERKPYEEEARIDKVRYYEEIQNFWKDNPARCLTNRTKINHVKKPSSAYALFLKDIKDDIKTQNPQMKMAEILKLISNRWKNLNEQTRCFYEDKAKKGREEAKVKLDEHHSKGELDYEKRKVQRLKAMRKKIGDDLSKTSDAKSSNLKYDISSQILETNLTFERIAKMCMDLTIACGLEVPVNYTYACSPSTECSITRIESTPKEDLDVLQHDTPSQVEQGFISDMISFDCNPTINIDSDDVDLSRSASSREDDNPFVQALEFEIPALHCISSSLRGNETIQNMLDYNYDEYAGKMTFKQVNNFVDTASWEKFLN